MRLGFIAPPGFESRSLRHRYDSSTMSTLPGRPPRTVAARLARMRSYLDDEIPVKQVEQNVLVGTWNIREFGAVTRAWRAGKDDSPKRDWGSVALIAEIVSRFDVVALQEVQGRIGALRQMLRFLGDDWGLLLTDVNRGHRGGFERMAYVFDTKRVRPSGLASELGIPEEWEGRRIGGKVLESFARRPYAVSFVTQGRTHRETFILVTVHIWYGKKSSERTPEIAAFSRWLADWATELSDYNQNLIALGDFNIDRADDPNYQALVSGGLTVPDELQGLRRTIFDTEDDHSHYDQVAWFTGERGDRGEREAAPALSLAYAGNAGHVDFRKVLRTRDKTGLSYRISDHYPLWVELLVR